MDWIHVAQSREQCQAVVNTAVNFQVLQNSGNLLSEKVLVSEEGFGSME